MALFTRGPIFGTVLIAVFWLLVHPCLAEPELKIDRSRARSLAAWKPRIVEYSQRHYGQATSKLTPQCIVLHYTAGAGFPWNLVNSQDFAGETPGLASHYVVDGTRVWEILPPDIRSRGCYGINHRAINIEMVALNAQDLASNRKTTLNTTTRLVRHLSERFRIPASEIYSHQQVATMDPSVVPGVLDLVNGTPYGKIDPGVKNMEYILARLRKANK